MKCTSLFERYYYLFGFQIDKDALDKQVQEQCFREAEEVDELR